VTNADGLVLLSSTATIVCSVLVDEFVQSRNRPQTFLNFCKHAHFIV